MINNDIFQSTPSVGRATSDGDANFTIDKISIHALRGEGDQTTQVQGISFKISIHALRGEGDAVPTRLLSIVIMISIHALRGEGDVTVIMSN